MKLLLIFFLLFATPLKAQNTEPLEPYWLVAATPLSLFVPGMGHYIRGETDTAKSFFKLHGINFAGIFTSAAALWLSGAADATVIPFIPIIFAGTSLWFALIGADLIGMSTEAGPEIRYPHAWNADFRARFRYRHLDDYVFDTSHYCEFGVGSRTGKWETELTYAFNTGHEIEIYNLRLDYHLFMWGVGAEGFYPGIHLNREVNTLGHFKQNIITYNLMYQLNLRNMSPYLNNLTMRQYLGVQSYFLEYLSPNYDDMETNTGLRGGVDLHWVLTPSVKALFGYSDARDTTLSLIASGFSGVSYAGFEWQFWDRLFLQSKYFFGKSNILDMAMETRF